jgi:mRNA-degrading endonuclease RelE of RelBE toxin-antitoxin system
MEDEIYITTSMGKQIAELAPTQQRSVQVAIDSLSGDGWKNSQIVAPDNTPGGGLRSVRNGDIRLLFRYSPEVHAIIVVDVASIIERELAVAS